MLVCISFSTTAHEIAGAARIRHSLRPLVFGGGRFQQASGASCREIANLCLGGRLVRRSSTSEGGSSIPETPMIEPKSRGVLDTPHARGMTAWLWVDTSARRQRCLTIEIRLQPISLQAPRAKSARSSRSCRYHPPRRGGDRKSDRWKSRCDRSACRAACRSPKPVRP